MFPSELVFAEFRTVSFVISGLFRLLRCHRLSPFVLCCLVDLFDVCFVDFCSTSHRRRTVAWYRQACLSAAAVLDVVVSHRRRSTVAVAYFCSGDIIVHSSSVEDDVLLLLISLS